MYRPDVSAEVPQLFESVYIPPYHTIPEYLAAIKTQPDRYAAVYSPIQLLETTLSLGERQTRKTILSLGCGRGFELVAERKVFGEESDIFGVDSASDLPTNTDLLQNTALARATLLLRPMEKIDDILSFSGVPDCIVVRHPIPIAYLRRPTEVWREVTLYSQSIGPWVKLAHERSILMVFSFFRKEQPLVRAFRTQILEPIVGEASVKEGNKGKMAYIYYTDDGCKIVPDYYWLRVN